jgi:predicted nucleotidyltransferase
MTLHDRFIDDDMRQRIDRELDRIERAHDVRILLAVESGSRAWRFPSMDSDYDVRFIYVHPQKAYVAIEQPRDVIETPLDGMLDLNGWDLRKALQLLVRSNAVLFEWLTSPVRYREVNTASARILTLARETGYLPALAYHYDRMARHSFGEIAASDDPVRFKTYCYALRPALALLWMRRHGEPAPMDVPTLLDGVSISQDVREAIDQLIERKARSDEHGTGPRMPILDNFLSQVLADPVERFVLPDRTTVLEQANALFASIIGEAT